MHKILILSDKAKIIQKLRSSTLNAHQNKQKLKQNTTIKCLGLCLSHQYPLAPDVLQTFLPAAAAQEHALFMHCAYLQKARSLPCSSSLWTTHKSAGLHRGALTQALQRLFTGNALANHSLGICWECNCWKGHIGIELLHTALLSVGSGGPNRTAPGQWIKQQSSQSHFNPSLPGLHLLYCASYTPQNPTYGLLNTWK